MRVPAGPTTPPATTRVPKLSTRSRTATSAPTEYPERHRRCERCTVPESVRSEHGGRDQLHHVEQDPGRGPGNRRQHLGRQPECTAGDLLHERRSLDPGAGWRVPQGRGHLHEQLHADPPGASSGLELAEDAQGDRNVYALLAEISIPVLKTMEFNVAVRYDDYSDVGNNFSPKVAWRWQAMDNLLLRASYNQGFRAPTLYDIYAPNSITITADTWDDPVLCPNGVPVTGADPARGLRPAVPESGRRQQATASRKHRSRSRWAWCSTSRAMFRRASTTGTRGSRTRSASFPRPRSSATRPSTPTTSCVAAQLTPAQQVALISTCGGQNAVDPLAYIVQTPAEPRDDQGAGPGLQLPGAFGTAPSTATSR